MIEKTYLAPTTEQIQIQNGSSILSTSIQGSSVEETDYRNGIEWN